MAWWVVQAMMHQYRIVHYRTYVPSFTTSSKKMGVTNGFCQQLSFPSEMM